MTDRYTVTLNNWQSAVPLLRQMGEWAKAMLTAGHRLTLEVKKATRSTEQNSLLWSVLNDLSRQVDWPVDGEKRKLEADEWKDVLSAGLRKNQRIALGIEGGWVMLGQRTSRLTVAEMSDLITLGHAFGDQHGVRWSRTSMGRDVPDEAFA